MYFSSSSSLAALSTAALSAAALLPHASRGGGGIGCGIGVEGGDGDGAAWSIWFASAMSRELKR